MRTIRASQADAERVAQEIGIAPRSALARDVTDRTTCPKFHVDRVTLRLMTTYRGPATEWLEGETVQQAQVHDVLFAKGESWPDLACDPRIHRSPQPRAGQTRVLLTLDAL